MMILGLYFLVTLVPLYVFIKLTMPAELRTIKITLSGLNGAIEEMIEDARALRETMRTPR